MIGETNIWDGLVGLAEHLGPVVATAIAALSAHWARKASKATRNGKGDVAHMTSGLVERTNDLARKIDAVHKRIDNINECMASMKSQVGQIDDRTIRHDERIRTLFGDLPRGSSRRRWR